MTLSTAFADIDNEELSEEQFREKRDEVCAAFAEAEGHPRAGQLTRLDYGITVALIVASIIGYLLFGFLVLEG